VSQIEHFIHGTAARLKRFRAALPAGIEVGATRTPGGLILRETLGAGLDSARAIARIEALAIANGVEYDGHGRDVEEANAPAGARLDIQSRAFVNLRISAHRGRHFRLIVDGISA
jgi:hypothetical protein